jgi:hypothetical protein
MSRPAATSPAFARAGRIGASRIGAQIMVAASGLLIACGLGERQPDEVVARVGAESIYERDVQRLAKHRPNTAREDHLQSLIDRRLVTLEARTRGLDKSPAYTRRLAWEVREKVINVYQAETVTARISITEEELRQLFERGRYGSEKRLSRVTVRSVEEGLDMRRRMLEKEVSVDSGDLGYLNRVGAAKAGIPPQVFADLRPGSASEVLPVDDGFAVVFCSAEREVEFAAYRDELRNSLRKERFVDEHLAVLNKLAAEYQLRPVAAGFAILVGRDPAAGPHPTLTRDQVRTPLFTYRGGRITVGEYLEAFRLAGERPAFGDSLRVHLAAWKLPIPKALVWQAATAAGVLDTEAMQSWKRRRSEKLLLRMLLRPGAAGTPGKKFIERLRRQYAGQIHRL